MQIVQERRVSRTRHAGRADAPMPNHLAFIHSSTTIVSIVVFLLSALQLMFNALPTQTPHLSRSPPMAHVQPSQSALPFVPHGVTAWLHGRRFDRLQVPSLGRPASPTTQPVSDRLTSDHSPRPLCRLRLQNSETSNTPCCLVAPTQRCSGEPGLPGHPIELR